TEACLWNSRAGYGCERLANLVFGSSHYPGAARYILGVRRCEIGAPNARRCETLSGSKKVGALLLVPQQIPEHTGAHKGFWNWTLRAVALGMVKEGSLTATRLEKLVAGMNTANAPPDTLVAHCRMHQLIARKPNKTS